MSRLDDELRVAFRRVEPPSDFAERVIGRINHGRADNPPAARPGLWQRLKNFLEPPVARWVAVGVATSLLVAIFAAQYRLQVVTPELETAPGIAERAPEVRTAPELKVAPELAPAPSVEKENAVKQKRVINKAAAGRNISSKNILARQRKERQQRVEAERARDQVMLALQIASSTLNDANKMVRGDD